MASREAIADQNEERNRAGGLTQPFTNPTRIPRCANTAQHYRR